MEQPIWIIIAIIIAVITFIFIVAIIYLAREEGLKNLQNIFNLSRFIETILRKER